jgi:hypothetical protein
MLNELLIVYVSLGLYEYPPATTLSEKSQQTIAHFQDL